MIHFYPVNILDAENHVRPLVDIEAEVIRFAIRHYGKHKRGRGICEVARRLQIGRSSLYRKYVVKDG